MRISDWSSDVCSSDLAGKRLLVIPGELESVGVFAAFADHRGRQPAIDGNLWLCRRLQHVGHLDPVADLVNVAVLRWKGLIALAAELALAVGRSEEHTSELQSLMRISYAVFCLKKNKTR